MDAVGILRKSQSWLDYKDSLQLLTDKQKGDCFELLSKYYLLLHPTYTTQLKDVWFIKEVPPRVRKHLNLPSLDEGIDLISETKDGEYWAIQCKYKTDETKSLTRKELSTFTDLAFNICKHIELGLICTTADRFSRKLTLYGDKLTFCAGDKWRGLDAEFFRRLHRHLGGKAATLKPLTARSHQRSAINSAYRHYHREGNLRGKLIMPCGTGKSLTGYWIANKLGAQKILIAVPSLALIGQTLEVWARESLAHKQDVRWIAVCSDETVGQVERDDIAVLAQDLGVRVHTDPKEIARWLRTHQDSPMVVFTTYQSGRVTAEAASKARLTFDVGILDEAHKTVGKKDSLFSHLLYNSNIKIDKRIFMTATERRYKGRSDQIVSMDDPDLYGEDFEVLSFKRALEADPPILSDYKIITIGISQDEVADMIERNAYVRPDKGKWDDEIEAEMLAGVIALRKAMNQKRIRHAVSFHSNIARARAFKASQDSFTAAFPTYGKLETFHVSGNTPTAVRSRELDEFAASKRSLITNARCLTEGVDVPDIDCVLFADPKRSTVDIVQAVGRALRIAKGKKYGYVVVPVLFDADLENSKAFEPVLTVLRALAANDERIVEYFRRISEGRKISSSAVEFFIDVPQGFTIDADDFINSVELLLWSRLAKLSWRPFQEAREFVQKLGLKGNEDWVRYCKNEDKNRTPKPYDIPASPASVYKDYWISWGDWLGTGYVHPAKRKYIKFEDARMFAQSLGLKRQLDWVRFCKGKLNHNKSMPEEIPANPRRYYQSSWVSWDDWLGTKNIKRGWRPFEDAREYVRQLKLSSSKEWTQYCKGDLSGYVAKPEDIPTAPNTVYARDGWVSMGDWLGTGYVASRYRKYRSFEEARKFAQNLKLKTGDEWNKYVQGKLDGYPEKPDDIPNKPDQTYKDMGWHNWGDWLGTGRPSKYRGEYRPFKEAREFVRQVGIISISEWKQYCGNELPNRPEKPVDIPMTPNTVYKNKGWVSWPDWFGKPSWRRFELARQFVRSLNLATASDWSLYCAGKLPALPRLPEDIPKAPYVVYKKHGWVGYGDWLGTGEIAPLKKKWRSFEDARRYVRDIKLKSIKEWWMYVKGELTNKKQLPDDIPSRPDSVYKKDGWSGWRNWLGTDKEWRPFEDARAFARSLGLRNTDEWNRYCKGLISEKVIKPNDIPAKPRQIYFGKGWVSMGDWLGTGAVATFNKEWRTFEDARRYVRDVKLKSTKEWWMYVKGELTNKKQLPDDIPSRPDSVYKKDGWSGWGDWLDTDTVGPGRMKWRPFNEARNFVRDLKLKSAQEWWMYLRNELPEKETKPYDIPARPDSAYKGKGWLSWPDWLGTNIKHGRNSKEK